LAISAWQPFDRSLETMLAILDDPGADLRAYATALDRLADAPEAVADALHDSDINAVLASCTFCGKRSRQVRRLIAGPEVLTCDQCVSTCVTVLEGRARLGLAHSDIATAAQTARGTIRTIVSRTNGATHTPEFAPADGQDDGAEREQP